MMVELFLSAAAGEAGTVMWLNGAAVLVFGILPQPLMSICFVAIKSL